MLRANGGARTKVNLREQQQQPKTHRKCLARSHCAKHSKPILLLLCGDRLVCTLVFPYFILLKHSCTRLLVAATTAAACRSHSSSSSYNVFIRWYRKRIGTAASQHFSKIKRCSEIKRVTIYTRINVLAHTQPCIGDHMTDAVYKRFQCLLNSTYTSHR